MTPQGIAEPEKKHIEGYENQPQTVDGISEWEPEQVWCEYESKETE
jgi:hypothetical protein